MNYEMYEMDDEMEKAEFEGIFLVLLITVLFSLFVAFQPGLSPNHRTEEIIRLDTTLPSKFR